MEFSAFIDPIVGPLANNPTVRSFDVLALVLTVGAVIVAVCVIDGFLPLLAAAALIGAFGALVIGAGQPVDIGFLLFGFLEAVVTGLAVLVAYAMRDLLAWKENAGPFAIFGMMGDGAKLALAPRRWPEAQDKPAPSGRDLAKRFFVAISAATGGMVGSLITTDEFWSSWGKSFTVPEIFRALLLTVVSTTLVGPLHEYILERGLEPADGGHKPIPERMNFFDRFSPSTVLRFGLVLSLWILLELTFNALAECVSSGNVDAMFQIILGGLAPGFVSYYWCAALQLGVPSVRQTATWPAVTAGAVMYCGLGAGFAVFFIGYLGILGAGAGAGEAMGAVLVFGGTTLAVSVAFSWLTCGTYSLCGGYAIDRYRGANVLTALFVALMVATIPQQLLADVLIGLAGNEVQPASWLAKFLLTLRYVSLFFGTCGWFFGLWASDFPQLVRRREEPQFAPA